MSSLFLTFNKGRRTVTPPVVPVADIPLMWTILPSVVKTVRGLNAALCDMQGSSYPPWDFLEVVYLITQSYIMLTYVNIAH